MLVPFASGARFASVAVPRFEAVASVASTAVLGVVQLAAHQHLLQQLVV